MPACKRSTAGPQSRLRLLDEATDEELLDRRFRDLPLQMKGTLLDRRVARLYHELRNRGIRALPHVWLSEEFFTPDGVMGFAVPFYLAHPRLMRLERSQMLEVEGAGEAECRRIFRHEAGHALDEAYDLSRRRRYRELFGDPTRPYPTAYQPQPDNRDYVVNLTAWYAQAHAVEDFAETFAVWLNPYSDWLQDYAGWPALVKLTYVDELMREIAGAEPPSASTAEIEPLHALERTLREHYREKRAHFAWTWPANYDQDLRRIFAEAQNTTEGSRATTFLRRVRAHLRTRIAEATGVHAYAVDQLIRQMIARAQELGLRVSAPHDEVVEKLLVVLAMQTANVARVGYPKVAL